MKLARKDVKENKELKSEFVTECETSSLSKEEK